MLFIDNMAAISGPGKSIAHPDIISRPKPSGRGARRVGSQNLKQEDSVCGQEEPADGRKDRQTGEVSIRTSQTLTILLPRLHGSAH
jgi:hypothetical protein